MVSKAPLEKRLLPGLAGRCFIYRNEHGRTKYQGFVHCVIPSSEGDLVLVQYFEALFGQVNTMALVPLSEMVSTSEAGGSPSGYLFFEDDAHLRQYFDEVQHHRDLMIDARRRGATA